MRLQNAAQARYGNFQKQSDASKQMEGECKILEQGQGHLQNFLTKSLKEQVSLTNERLSGSQHLAAVTALQLERERELVSLQGGPGNTKANKENMAARYDAQIAAEMELQQIADRRFIRESAAQGTMAALITEEQKRVRLAESALAATKETLTTSQYLSEETRRGLLTQQLEQEQALKIARAEFAVAESQHGLAQKTVGLQATNASAASKQYETTRGTLDACASNWRSSRT